MASAGPINLPLFYNNLVPLQSTTHGNFKTRPTDKAPYLANTHVVPVTIDEFATVQRTYPIVFSVGEAPVPLALMGLNEGVNVFLDDEGKARSDVYVPAYARRYPFLLVKLRPENEELSLCFDPTSDMVGEFEDGGQALFEDGKITETTQAVMKFCEEFEISAQKTNQFMKELVDSGLLIDGEVSINQPGGGAPFIYRGFKMVSEEKLRELRGDALRKMNQTGMLALIFAHLFSLAQIREVFAKQHEQGKLVAQQPPGAVQFPAGSLN